MLTIEEANTLVKDAVAARDQEWATALAGRMPSTYHEQVSTPAGAKAMRTGQLWFQRKLSSSWSKRLRKMRKGRNKARDLVDRLTELLLPVSKAYTEAPSTAYGFGDESDEAVQLLLPRKILDEILDQVDQFECQPPEETL